MPLNYAKWDQLELSDDSDIEGHPNVDKRSLIRWKQRDIHEKREARKHKISSLKVEIESNENLLKRLQTIADSLVAASSPSAKFSSVVQVLKENPSSDAPPVNSLGQSPTMTYDEMVLHHLLQISEAAKKSSEGDTSVGTLDKALIEGINGDLKQLAETTEGHRRDLDAEEKEKAKRITVEDMHEGFDNKYVPPKPAPAPITPIPAPKQKTKATTTTFETLNPQASTSSSSPTSSPAQPTPETEEDIEEELPELTPSLVQFSCLPLYSYEKSWEFIQQHPDVIVQGAADALLVAAFRSQGNGDLKYAKGCVHQSLLLQYCDKLGPDGVRVFFRKMIAGDKRAESIFVDDVERTYAHLVSRVAAAKAEAASEGLPEQIQLVPEKPGQKITFNIPEGPPPVNLVVEGPGSDTVDIEDVRGMWQLRWDIFQGFSEELQNALRTGSLDSVNKVLGVMSVEEAESIVKRLDMGGILNFAEGGIRDARNIGLGDDGNEGDDEEEEEEETQADADEQK